MDTPTRKVSFTHLHNLFQPPKKTPPVTPRVNPWDADAECLLEDVRHYKTSVKQCRTELRNARKRLKVVRSIYRLARVSQRTPKEMSFIDHEARLRRTAFVVGTSMGFMSFGLYFL